MSRWVRLMSMPFTVAGGYTLAAVLWIVFSDQLVAWMAGGDFDLQSRLQTWKGLGFVVASGILLCVVLLAWNHHRLRMESRMKVVSEKRERDHQRIQAELNAFMYAISHDLRAPLRALSGFSSALVEDHAGQLDERGRQDLKHINDAANRLSMMIDGLIVLSRLGRRTLSRTEFDMDALAREVMDEVRRQAPREDAEVEFAGLPVVRADRDMMARALHELFDNAWKFSQPVPRAIISFRGAPRRGITVFELKDNGVGFDMRFGEKLFMPFHRAHREDTFEGIGLGLAVAHRVIDRHGGWIDLESVQGQGITVRFTLEDGHHGT